MIAVSSTATATGGALFGLLLLNGLSGLFEPEGIQVHRLAYNGAGSITQARTVHADEPFHAVFAAEIHATTKPDAPICKGGGGWPYKPGFIEVDIGINEWVGDDADCAAKLPADTWLVACAEWSWGEDSVKTCSLRFKL